MHKFRPLQLSRASLFQMNRLLAAPQPSIMNPKSCLAPEEAAAGEAGRTHLGVGLLYALHKLGCQPFQVSAGVKRLPLSHAQAQH